MALLGAQLVGSQRTGWWCPCSALALLTYECGEADRKQLISGRSRFEADRGGTGRPKCSLVADILGSEQMKVYAKPRASAAEIAIWHPSHVVVLAVHPSQSYAEQAEHVQGEIERLFPGFSFSVEFERLREDGSVEYSVGAAPKL